MQRNVQRFKNARNNIEIGKLSGAVGNFANIDPFIQQYVCKKLDIGEANVATQVIQRDVYAEYFATLALIGATIEKIATEIRHLQRTEIHEVEEMFAKGQKGSSAMPHKRNPIASENMCGCARVLRGYMLTSYENISL
jgi:adenylosuccinate lyase